MPGCIFERETRRHFPTAYQLPSNRNGALGIGVCLAVAHELKATSSPWTAQRQALGRPALGTASSTRCTPARHNSPTNSHQLPTDRQLGFQNSVRGSHSKACKTQRSNLQGRPTSHTRPGHLWAIVTHTGLSPPGGAAAPPPPEPPSWLPGFGRDARGPPLAALACPCSRSSSAAGGRGPGQSHTSELAPALPAGGDAAGAG